MRKLILTSLPAVLFTIPAEAKLGLFLTCFEIGNAGTFGAPVMPLYGVFDAPAGTMSGSATVIHLGH